MKILKALVRQLATNRVSMKIKSLKLCKNRARVRRARVLFRIARVVSRFAVCSQRLTANLWKSQK